MKTTSLIAMAAFALGAQADNLQLPKENPISGQMKSQGCFSSGGNLQKQTLDHVASGNCFQLCQKLKKNVMGLSTDKCYCGDKYPPKDDLLDDDKCDYPCPGYGKEACGALSGIFSIFNTGVEVDVDSEEPVVTTSSAAAAQPTQTTPSDAPGNSAVTSESAAPTNDKEEKKGPPTAAIAAGVVAGVVVIAAVIGVLVFFVKRRRNAEIEEEHRRNAAVNAFINGSKPPGSSGSISMTDSRLDPVMAHRRLSDGSIADNQDYSRRILRVTNA